MGVSCLSECSSCQRHVRCGERVCPFCGAQVSTSLRAVEYRILNRFDRSRAFSLGAALAAAGFLTSCEDEGGAVYGAPCNPPSCMPPGGSAGQPSTGGKSGSGSGGVSGSGAGSGGHAGTPANGGEGGVTVEGGAAGQGGAIEIIEGGGWNRSDGGASGEGGVAGEGGVYEINESGAWNRGESGNGGSLL